MNPASEYGDHNASFYDQIYPNVEPGLLACLQTLADDGPVLELGTGTGRVAIPLAARGVSIHGIDASMSMIRSLQGRPGGGTIPLQHGDFAEALLGGPYRLVFALASTLRLLPSADRLRQCFANIAAHLMPDGKLLLEDHDPESVTETPVLIEVPIHTGAGLKTYRVRYLALDSSEVDALATEAGLKLVARWRDWRHTPWAAGSSGPQRHVSIYGLGFAKRKDEVLA